MTWTGGLENRPDWDSYFMTLTFVISQKSFDPNTCCGAVLVSKDKRILATGYNGPIKGAVDINIPTTAPEKYYHFLHAEENCLLSFYGSPSDIEGSTMYITGRMCHKCFRMMLQKGIKNFVIGHGFAKCVDEADMKAQELMMIGQGINIKEFNNIEEIEKLLNRTADYIKYKAAK